MSLSADEIIERILTIWAHPFPRQRAIIAKELRKADDWIIQHSKIKTALKNFGLMKTVQSRTMPHGRIKIKKSSITKTCYRQ